jgi:predicted alpha/beta hydrolase family esterase
MTNVTIVFIHGYTSSHRDDWYPNISRELDKLGVNYLIPDLPGGERPHASEWLKSLHAVISQIHTPIILVGHSLGTRAALLYLEKYQPKVEKVILIAAFNNQAANGDRNDGETYSDFFEHAIDLEKIKPLVGEFIIMHSRDDDSIPYEQGVEIAKDLHAELLTYEDAGHFFQPEYAKFVLEVLRRKLKLEAIT